MCREGGCLPASRAAELSAAAEPCPASPALRPCVQAVPMLASVVGLLYFFMLLFAIAATGESWQWPQGARGGGGVSGLRQPACMQTPPSLPLDCHPPASPRSSPPGAQYCSWMRPTTRAWTPPRERWRRRRRGARSGAAAPAAARPAWPAWCERLCLAAVAGERQAVAARGGRLWRSGVSLCFPSAPAPAPILSHAGAPAVPAAADGRFRQHRPIDALNVSSGEGACSCSQPAASRQLSAWPGLGLPAWPAWPRRPG